MNTKGLFIPAAAIAVGLGLSVFLFFVSPLFSACRKDWTKCSDNEDLVSHYLGASDAKYACQRMIVDQARSGVLELDGTKLTLNPRSQINWKDQSWLWFNFNETRKGNDFLKSGIIYLVDSKEGVESFINNYRVIIECWYDLNKQTAIAIKVNMNHRKPQRRKRRRLD